MYRNTIQEHQPVSLTVRGLHVTCLWRCARIGLIKLSRRSVCVRERKREREREMQRKEEAREQRCKGQWDDRSDNNLLFEVFFLYFLLFHKKKIIRNGISQTFCWNQVFLKHPGTYSSWLIFSRRFYYLQIPLYKTEMGLENANRQGNYRNRSKTNEARQRERVRGGIKNGKRKNVSLRTLKLVRQAIIRNKGRNTGIVLKRIELNMRTNISIKFAMRVHLLAD